MNKAFKTLIFALVIMVARRPSSKLHRSASAEPIPREELRFTSTYRALPGTEEGTVYGFVQADLRSTPSALPLVNITVPFEAHAHKGTYLVYGDRAFFYGGVEPMTGGLSSMYRNADAAFHPTAFERFIDRRADDDGQFEDYYAIPVPQLPLIDHSERAQDLEHLLERVHGPLRASLHHICWASHDSILTQDFPLGFEDAAQAANGVYLLRPEFEAILRRAGAGNILDVAQQIPGFTHSATPLCREADMTLATEPLDIIPDWALAFGKER